MSIINKAAAALLSLLVCCPALADGIINPGGSASSVQFQQSGAGAVTRTMQNKARDILNASDFSNATGDAAQINAAIVQAKAVGGAIVNLQCKEYDVTASIDMTTAAGVVLNGCGSGQNGSGTIIKWTGSNGGGPVVDARSPSTPLYGIGLNHVFIDCNGLATTGLRVGGVGLSSFNDWRAQGCTSNQIEWGVSADGSSGSQGNLVTNFTADASSNAASASADAFHITTGSATSNTNWNQFFNAHLLHKNGVGFYCGNADSNVFQGFLIARSGGGTGNGVVLDNTATATELCNSNEIRHLQSDGPIVSNYNAANSSMYNKISVLSVSGGASTATVSAGSSLTLEDVSTGKVTQYIGNVAADRTLPAGLTVTGGLGVGEAPNTGAAKSIIAATDNWLILKNVNGSVPSNQGRWRLASDGNGGLFFQSLDDSSNFGMNAMTMSRNGSKVSRVDIRTDTGAGETPRIQALAGVIIGNGGSDPGAGNLAVLGLSGGGNLAVCVDTNGKLYTHAPGAC